MKVNADLLRKYHNNQCTPSERIAVEDWLLNSEVDALAFHTEKDKDVIKDAIWKDVASVLPPKAISTEQLLKPAAYYVWKGAVAATLFIALLGSAIYYFNRNSEKPAGFMVFRNTSALKVNHINSRSYSLTIGTETSAEINEHNGVIDLAGSILISPKKDIELKFDDSNSKVHLKKGQTYIIINSKSGNHSLIVVNEKNLINLSPVIQKKLIQEFDI
ncbi:hypothetical protein FW774_11680 [Pedobacter sp. BS3]|uniref:hypothetical protein n=1 Tax=Pedobacter sp. BS3 TaxID=2567937 RepID=UPI0011F05AF4|nr:hypothetical protein [Pedobacter sp. BS3]TZF84094.1 hypothetical protein FW774_11680 [Pedobacter sp. BS3]